jgi:hypothetical protein
MWHFSFGGHHRATPCHRRRSRHDARWWEWQQQDNSDQWIVLLILIPSVGNALLLSCIRRLKLAGVAGVIPNTSPLILVICSFQNSIVIFQSVSCFGVIAMLLPIFPMFAWPPWFLMRFIVASLSSNTPTVAGSQIVTESVHLLSFGLSVQRYFY